ncbi:ArsR/SmtB family transcription factor [Paracoccus saliphilus]|uniref:Transcriptional regulator, ArsR family n=1 Tax=Paracoccus saliphilus TaxID=405559 RepID=A0AA45W6M7_9RHOB|nr:winged helix-turn-helix transcriptional regulator [Paracoccus saliphilus]SIT03276.1 transcriptional regulator, ArsR family [Paracoccus saliphilus]
MTQIDKRDRTADDEVSSTEMMRRATEAASFLKALAHEGRMMILCHLAAGEKTVTELEKLLNQRQAAVSQQLARLRAEGLVTCRRDGKARLYSVADPRAAEVVGVMYRLFCAD